MEEEKQNKDLLCKVNEQVEKSIEEIIDSGVTPTNLDNLGKLVDIHKDLKNEEYWKVKEENFMRYGNYGRESYGRDEYGEGYGTYGRRSRDSRGRYTEGNSYGRRYRGHDMLDDMYGAYSDYMESGEYGNYGTGESIQKIEIMADSLMDFIHHIKKEAKTPEEKQLIDEKLREIGRI